MLENNHQLAAIINPGGTLPIFGGSGGSGGSGTGGTSGTSGGSGGQTGIINPALPIGIGTGKGEVIVGGVVGAVIGILFIFGCILALIHFMLGAHKWITSSGDKGRLETAREQITQALVGLLILASIWAVMLLVGSFLGFSLIKFSVPTI